MSKRVLFATPNPAQVTLALTAEEGKGTDGNVEAGGSAPEKKGGGVHVNSALQDMHVDTGALPQDVAEEKGKENVGQKGNKPGCQLNRPLERGTAFSYFLWWIGDLGGMSPLLYADDGVKIHVKQDIPCKFCFSGGGMIKENNKQFSMLSSHSIA
ncbi:hypothetical protein C2845_PM15G10430 [Panicum miliaceum]|uniref:Uncharacterized protein n=1 Tax=Panicum miliaceum TaxID=4540 RepID=A0A3L6Q9Y1_PANMI|nr:hypothetical protein C2845_PM15G10430 [Panicum miliaceum]